MKISLLHTSNSHIDRFNKIIQKIDDSIKVRHYVNEELLAIAQQTGKLDQEAFIEEINQIQKEGSDIIICTCSTYGEVCEKLEKVHRIDKPIIEHIVSAYSQIGIAFTSKSTRQISKRLIENIAQQQGQSIEIIEIDCSHCWDWFTKGDFEKYEVEIGNTIKRQPYEMEVVFLAQASMEGAKKYLKNEDYQVVSSPEYGMRKYIEKRKKWISKK